MSVAQLVAYASVVPNCDFYLPVPPLIPNPLAIEKR
jgi:hypothetical protein